MNVDVVVGNTGWPFGRAEQKRQEQEYDGPTDAFAELVRLAKVGGVDIPAPSKAANVAMAMCGPTGVSDDVAAAVAKEAASVPGLPAGLTKPPWLRQRAPGRACQRVLKLSLDTFANPCF